MSSTNPIYETTKDMFNQLKAQGAARYKLDGQSPGFNSRASAICLTN